MILFFPTNVSTPLEWCLLASEGSPGTRKRRGTTPKMDDRNGSRVVLQVGCHQAEASRHPCWRRLLQHAGSRQSPIALCLFSAGTCPQGLSGDRNRFSPLRMLRPMAPPPSPPLWHLLNLRHLCHISDRILWVAKQAELFVLQNVWLHLYSWRCLCSCWGRWHLSQFWHHPCLHRAEKGTRRISLAGLFDRVPKICLAIGDKVPPSHAFDGVAILQSDESFANPGRQGLQQ